MSVASAMSDAPTDSALSTEGLLVPVTHGFNVRYPPPAGALDAIVRLRHRSALLARSETVGVAAGPR